MKIQILEVVEAGKEVSCLVVVESETTWMTGSTVGECLAEAVSYVTSEEADCVEVWKAIDTYKAKCEAKAADGLNFYKTILATIAKYS